MNKKFIVVLIIFAIAVIGGYYILNSDKFSKNNNNSVINLTNINEIKVYKLDYATKEYNEVAISNTEKDNLRKELKSFESIKCDSIGIYGKYKMIIDTHEFYFDNANQNEIYYKNDDTNITFPINVLVSLKDDKDTCSCCSNKEVTCKINICKCIEE